eukprot:7035612-Prymnesium_polylepis.1
MSTHSWNERERLRRRMVLSGCVSEHFRMVSSSTRLRSSSGDMNLMWNTSIYVGSYVGERLCSTEMRPYGCTRGCRDSSH